jgi:hypothetical protein
VKRAQSEPEASFPEGEPPVALTKLKNAHHLLIHHYIHILKEVSKLRPLGGHGYWQELYGGDISVWKVYVRLFAEAHIRRQMRVLSRLYLLQQGLPALSSDQKNWLGEAHKSCEEMLSAIPSRQTVKLFLTTASPVVLGLLLATLGADNIYEVVVKAAASQEFLARIEPSRQNAFLVVYVFFAALLFSLPFATSFAYKRGLFFPRVRHLEATSWSKRRSETHRKVRGLPESNGGTNVYEIEDGLFQLLSFGKPREPQVDVMVTVWTLVSAILAWVLLVVAARGELEPAESAISLFVVAGICSLGIARALQVAHRRTCR